MIYYDKGLLYRKNTCMSFEFMPEKIPAVRSIKLLTCLMKSYIRLLSSHIFFGKYGFVYAFLVMY